MSSAYLAISYKCNQKCRFCPCSREEAKYPYIELENLLETIRKMKEERQINSIVISGGEPTLHPFFFELLEIITTDLEVTVLSNSERFSDRCFLEKIVKSCQLENLRVITTIHSQDEQEHEWINQTRGSFERTIQGLKNLNHVGIQVTVKHCITKRNYQDLKKFYRFIDESFPEEVDIQMCSIDYCGFPEEEKYNHMVVFPELAPFFEEMFDDYIEALKAGSRRHMYCINMPLCAADPYYWEFFAQKPEGYVSYAAPEETGQPWLSNEVEMNTGTLAEECRGCKAEEICPGTYRSAFEYFGSKIVRGYKE